MSMTITISSLLSFQRWSVLWARHPAKILHKSSPTSPVADIETLRARAALPPSEQAAFAVTSRLLSSFVTEALLRAIYVPVSSSDCAGLCVIVTSDADLNGRLGTPDIYGVIPLHHTPIIKEDGSNQARYGSTIWLLDPLDMYPAVYHLGYGEDGTQTRFDSTLRFVFASSPWDIEGTFDFVETLDPAFWWNRFAEDAGLDKTLQASLLDEISSSYMWQQVVYYAPPPCPSLSSPAIQWEQSLVEGHPTHPMHRARRTLPPIPPVTPGMRDWYCPRVRFAAIERSRLSLLGPFEDHVRELVEAAAAKSGKQLPVIEPEYCIMPLYDLQVANIAEKFPGAIIFDPEISLEAQGQASLRTVSLKESPLALKLAVGIKVSSAIRTISHFTANIGPRFSEEIVPKLAIDPSILYIEREISSSVCVRTADGSELDQDIAKHFTAVFRQAYSPASDEAVILVAALGETGHSNGPPGVPAVQHLLDLDTYNKRLAFFDEYTQFLVAGVIPPLIKNGLGFEAHPQNTLVRISKITGRVLGFVMRDLGGIRVHPPTLRASTGVDFTFLPEHCIVTETCEEAAKKLYHTLVFNHIQRLARVLGVHYDGSGWATFRKHLAAVIPRDSWLWPLWMADDAKSVSGKCLVRMKLAGLYRDSVYEPFPNMIQFRAAHKCL